MGQVVRRFQKGSGQGIVAISRRVGERSEGEGFRKSVVDCSGRSWSPFHHRNLEEVRRTMRRRKGNDVAERDEVPENLWSRVREGAGVFSGSIGSCFGLSSAKRDLMMSS